VYLLVDNYDSFTHILHHYIVGAGVECVIQRYDEVNVEEIETGGYEGIILSPGPEHPKDYPKLLSIIRFCDKTSLPLLGVCLGHQSLGVYFGSEVLEAVFPMHGKASMIEKAENIKLFELIPNKIQVGRYHSLRVESKGLSPLIQITSQTADGTIMSMEHISKPMVGVQFHPESILTEFGHTMIANWCHRYKKTVE